MFFNTNTSLSDKKIDRWVYPILILLSIVFLLIVSTSTSPLYSGYGGDSAVFVMFGRMFNSGKIPYTDFFDHKGPMVIFIQAFAQKIYPPDSKISTFILQIINISFIQILIYKTLRLLLKPINSISISLFIIFYLRYIIEGGNLTEEYSLLFISITFYYTVKVLIKGLSSLNNLQCIVVGICSAMLFWIRLNNTGVVFACLLFIGILLIKDKQWRKLLTYGIFFLIGFLIISVPIIAYFVQHNAFQDMINAAFIHNLKYVESSHPDESYFVSLTSIILHIFKAWLPFIILFIGTIVSYLKTKKANIIIFSTLLVFFGYFTTHIGNAYTHYMMLCIPLLILGLMYLAYTFVNGQFQKKICIFILILISISTVAILVKSEITNNPFDNEINIYDRDAREIGNFIPQEDRNSVYPYEVVNSFLPASGLQPCYKYFMMQEWTGIANKHIIIEINDMMRNNPPKWVVTQNGVPSTNAEFWKVLEQNYELSINTQNYRAYKLKTEQ